MVKEKLSRANTHNLGYQRFSISDMEAIWGVLAKADTDYTKLKAERDALAAENLALKSAVDEVSKSAEDCEFNGGEQRYVVLPDSFDALTDLLEETPATESYLNSVRAEGVDFVAEAIGAKCAELKIGSKDWKALKSIVFVLGGFSSKLRAGEPS